MIVSIESNLEDAPINRARPGQDGKLPKYMPQWWNR